MPPRTRRLYGQDARNWLANRRAENEELKKMSGAARKKKLTKYEVTIRREVEHVAVVEVEARNAEEACETAESIVDGLKPTAWREGDVTAMSAKAKVLRG